MVAAGVFKELFQSIDASGIPVLKDKLQYRLACRLDLLRRLCPEHAAYLDFQAAHPQQSFSQIGQDLFVLHVLNGKRGGYFVEFGATDGVSLSNTCLLERRFGWRGICAEPSRQWHRELRANRKCEIDTRCVWSNSGDSLAFSEYEDGEYSKLSSFDATDGRALNRRLARQYEVETVTLTDLLAWHDAPAEIDYLSIDTEGSELEILAAHDFNRHRFRIITVEHNGSWERRRRIARLLLAQGYRRSMPALSRWDDWYVLREPAKES